ncbi:UDP-N-acetylglucosamine--N-acetylglucosamine transferase [Streptomyces sp. SL13]|uniref:UDP-N-acetylglucosamine--N-acetylglucosamine transferase n=1 Tax=Streptantibioticus silvisoli TaxID=2705255 RepID=A0AA90K7J3_9ACTN|nr:UDP-N-acetylglucosamine--N-acetylglucosamine transferase [Streptantibioticus silvisoli]MDI5968352.1 UDP-N-acetylglucosamine--N-acetylglucosamine transferase [Streptantibioticus silvisoli]
MPYLDSPAGAGPARVAIVSASVGAGHDGAAAELSRRLTARGVAVDRFDFLDLLPARLGTLLGGTYHQLLTHAPWAYQRIYATTERPGRGRVSNAVLRAAEHRTLRALRPGTRAVVATYPLAGQVLGALRRDGRLTVPVLTYLTDFSVHPLWVAPGVDTHLALHPIPAGQAEACGAHRVLTRGPVVDPRFGPATPQARRAARTRFGLPPHGPLALLVAGSWGVGPVEQAAARIRACGAAVPVVVCGRNQALADRLRAAGTGHVFGWVDDMPGLMHAADVLVQNAGGLTSLEAFASGLPVASYGCIPGHGRTNAAALDAAGLATWIRHADDLGPVLTGLLDGPAGSAQRAAGLALFARGDADGPAAAILDAARRPTPGRGGVTVRVRPERVPAAPVTPAVTAAASGPGAAAVPVRAGRAQRRTALVLAAALATTLLAGPDSTEDAVARGGTHLLHDLDL